MRSLLLAVALFAAPLQAADFPFGTLATGGFPTTVHCSNGGFVGPLLSIHDRSGTTLMHPSDGLAVTSVGTTLVSAASVGEAGGIWILDQDGNAQPFTNAPLGRPNGSAAVVFGMTSAGD